MNPAANNCAEMRSARSKNSPSFESQFHIFSTFNLPPLQGAPLCGLVPRVETLG
jgi:hypothetical protein